MTAKTIQLPVNVEVLADNIPAYLKAQKKWLLWRWEKQGDRYTKPPYKPDGIKSDGAVNPNDWSDFETIWEAVQTKRFSGIGFVLNDEDNLIAWDLDHCLNVKTGEMEPWAADLVAKLHSYTEITPSGDGLRIFIFGEVPKDGAQKKRFSSPDGERRGVVECYKNKRYTTVTGNHYPTTPLEINNCENSVEIWKSVWEASPDDPYLKRLYKSVKAKRLFEGDWKKDYESQSEADLALCRYLADVVDGDAEKLDTLFRQSKLLRPKWDIVHTQGRTYGAATIQTALESYSKSYRLTDTGDAKRLAKLIQDEARFCQGTWFIWDGKRLVEDQLQRAYLLMDKLVQDIVDEAKNCEIDEKKKKLIQHAQTLESRSKAEAVLKLVQSREPIPILYEELDRNPYAFNCANGIMERGDLKPHAFTELMSKVSPVAYLPRVDAPIWDSFLKDCFGDDEQMQSYIARCVGYSMTGFAHEEVIFFLHGLGANGKSTFLNTLMSVFGEYARVIPTELLMIGKDLHPTVLADLRGLRMAVATEIPEGKRFNEELIKAITGGEKITARRMFKDYFEFQPIVKLWIMGNHKPQIRGTDLGIRRRFHLIPFTRTVPPEKRDPYLKDKLKRELEGILNWCVRGYLDWLEQGLNPPDFVKAATNEYFDDMDSILSFINEECEIVAGHKENAKKMYERYSSFAKQRNEYIFTSRQFIQKVMEKGYQREKGGSSQPLIVGLKLTSNSDYVDLGM